MRRLSIFLIGFSFMFACTEKENPKALPSEPAGLKIIVDDELGDGAYFKDFLDAIKNKDCKHILSMLDEKVHFSLGEGTNAIFSGKTGYREEKLKFSICDLFFDSIIVKQRVIDILETNDFEYEYGSPRDWLDKSREIRFITMEEKNGGSKVNVVFLGGRSFKPEAESRDVDFLFSCPDGFMKKCFLYSFSF